MFAPCDPEGQKDEKRTTKPTSVLKQELHFSLSLSKLKMEIGTSQKLS
jgi:hypothetical protein